METIFVSSTFKDMQAERDQIRDTVLPRLEEEARRHGQSIDFCDLRWGIETSTLSEQAASERVMGVCLNEIDRSDPPMVVLLGDRYGWMPGPDLMDHVASSYGFDLDLRGLSVTATEVIFGTFLKRKNTLFFFREIRDESSARRGLSGGDAAVTPLPSLYRSEDSVHSQRLADLKLLIQSRCPSRVRRYTLVWDGTGFTGKSLKGFSNLVTETLMDSLLPAWSKSDGLTPIERLMQEQWRYVDERDSLFVGCDAETRGLVSLIEGNNAPVIIKGEPGIGKSSLLCHLAKTLESKGWTVLPVICGLSSRTTDVAGVLQTCIDYLCHLMGISDPGVLQQTQATTPGEILVEHFNTACQYFAHGFSRGNGPLVIMIDAVDQLLSDNLRESMAFIPKHLCPTLKFCMTCLPGTPTAAYPYLTLRGLSEADKSSVISELLRRHHKQGLSSSVVRFMTALPQSASPLYLSLLVLRLSLMDGTDFASIARDGGNGAAISKRQLEILRRCPHSIEGMYREVFDEAARRISPRLVPAVLSCIAVTRHGLRSTDLAALLGGLWNPLDYAHLVNYISDCFIMRPDGRLDFMHKSARENYGPSPFERQTILEAIFHHLEALPEDDPVRRSEYAWHCMAANKRDAFSDYLGWLGQLPENQADAYIEAAEDCMRDYCLQDSGDWLCAELEYLASRESVAEEAYLLVDDMINRTGAGLLSSRQELTIAARLLESCLPLIRRKQRECSSDGIRREEVFADYLSFLNELARTYRSLGKSAEAERVAKLSQKEAANHGPIGLHSACEAEEVELARAQDLISRGDLASVSEAIGLCERKFSGEGGDLFDLRVPIEMTGSFQEQLRDPEFRKGSMTYQIWIDDLGEEREREYRTFGDRYAERYNTLVGAYFLHAQLVFASSGGRHIAAQDEAELRRLADALGEANRLMDPTTWGRSPHVANASREELEAFGVLSPVRQMAQLSAQKNATMIRLWLAGTSGTSECVEAIDLSLRIAELLEEVQPRDFDAESYLQLQLSLLKTYRDLETLCAAIGSQEMQASAHQAADEVIRQNSAAFKRLLKG